MAKQLYLDVARGQFIEGLASGRPANVSAFEGDNADYELYFVRSSGAFGNFEPLDYSAKSVKLHIGPQPPSTATAYVAAEAWSNLPATVTATIIRSITGGAATNEQQTLSFSPEAYSGTFVLTFPSQTLTVNSVSGGVFTTSGSHGFGYAQGFVVTGFTGLVGFVNGQTLYAAQIISATQFFANTSITSTVITGLAANAGGTAYTLTGSSAVIDARASLADVQSSLESMPSIGQGNVRVTGSQGISYALNFTGAKTQTTFPLMSVASALTPVYGKTATLNFNTTELYNAISASASIPATLEIEISQGGTIETVAQALVTLNNDIIATTGGVPVAVSPAAFFYLQAPDNSIYSISIDNDGILTSEKIS